MKKTKTLFGIVLLTIICALFVSCGDDNDTPTGVTLSGSWRTEVDCPTTSFMFKGNKCDIQADYRQMVFYPVNKFTTAGTGKMVDFYPYGPIKKIYRSFTWELDKSDPTNTITIITFLDNAEILKLYKTQINADSFGFYYNEDLKDGVLFEPDNSVDWEAFDFYDGNKTEERENWEVPYENWLSQNPQRIPGSENEE